MIKHKNFCYKKLYDRNTLRYFCTYFLFSDFSLFFIEKVEMLVIRLSFFFLDFVLILVKILLDGCYCHFGSEFQLF